MSAASELKQIAKDRLGTLQMFVSMLTALVAVCIVASAVCALLGQFTSQSFGQWPVLLLLCAIFFAWLRYGVHLRCQRKEEYIRELDEQYPEPRRGGLLI